VKVRTFGNIRGKVAITVEKVHTVKGHRDCVYTLSASSSSNIFFSGSGDGMIVQWDMEHPDDGSLIARMPQSVYALAHHRETDLVIAGHNYEGIHLLDWKNKKDVGSLKLTSAPIFDIAAVGEKLVVASGDGAVHLIEVNGLRIIHKNILSEKSARCVAVNLKSGHIVVGYSDNFIRVMDFDFKLIKQWEAHKNSVFTVRYMPDGKRLISGSRDARLKVWDVESGYEQTTEIVAHMYAINHVEFSPDGKHFVTCSMDKSIKVWDLAELKLLKVIDRARHAGHGTSVNKLLWTSFNDQLVSASDDRTISVWHIIF
jgi:WD40 repeat protein